MLQLSSHELRTKWQQFRENNKHAYLPEASLIADKESTALFNVAGMQQLIPFLVGKAHPLGARLYNIQKCVRTNDIDDIGDERHLSLFEMMGNWSLGDYFKKESITWTVQFLHHELQIPLDKIGATVFAGDTKQGIPRDEESLAILADLGITNIKEMWFDDKGESDNFWTPGPIGPCGPCAEFYYDRGEAYGPTDRDMWVNDRYTEIWNNVFMSYYSDGSGKLTELPQKNVDTGMGFERLLLVLQNGETVFDTDILRPLVQIADDTLPLWDERKNIPDIHKTHIESCRVFADHLRTATFLIRDGIEPSNEGKWYVVRRLIRRVCFRFRGAKTGVLENSVSKIVEKIKELHPHETLDTKKITQSIKKEINKFNSTIDNGETFASQVFRKIKQGDIKWKEIAGSLFTLFESFGYPYELSIELFENGGGVLDKNTIKKDFDEKLKEAQDRSRAATKGKFTLDVDRSAYIQWLPSTQFIWYKELQNTESKLLKDFVVNDQRVLVFDKTPFYAEWGGQTWDRGVITLDSGEQVQVVDVKKYEGIYLHIVQ